MSTSHPKVSAYIAMSVDGYIAKEDGSLDWLNFAHTSSDEDYGFKTFMDSVDVLIMGRNTYDVVASFDKWPYPGKKVIVLSKKLKEVRQEAELFSGDIHKLISSLHSEGIEHIYVDGGLTICSFLEKNLIDQMILTVIPTTLGKGIRLFTPVEKNQNLHLVSTNSYPNGLVQLHYKLK